MTGEDKMKKLYLNDFILNIIIILLCISIPICLSVVGKNDKKQVIVSYNGDVVKIMSPDEDDAFGIEGVQIEIKNGTAFVAHSDCPDGLCMKMKKAKNVGDSIICVPNKVSVRIVGDGEDKGADVIAG